MALDYQTLELLRQNHPAWRLLCSPQAPLIATFLGRVFIEPNVRVLSQSDLVEMLEDEIYVVQQVDPDKFPKNAKAYLNDWADNSRGWLRKFYPPNSDEPHFDLTPAAEKGIGWLDSLSQSSFVGTESKLLTLFELLRQMDEGSEPDPETRIAELKKRRDEIDLQIEKIEDGDISLLNDAGIKDRFQQFQKLSRELLGDFREVEHNFRKLDRSVREQFTLWEGAKGELLEEIMMRRDSIAGSDQGRSFQAFWDFLMSRDRQEEFTKMLERILTLDPVYEMEPDSRIRRIHYDWLEAGEYTQRTVARLSQQLRRFLDNQAWLENRRIMDILHSVENRCLSIRQSQPAGDFMEVDNSFSSVDLPLERPLYTPPVKPVISDIELEEGDADVDIDALYSQVVVDKNILLGNIRRNLQEVEQISLAELAIACPLEHGLAELIAYLQLASNSRNAVVDEETKETVRWQGEDGCVRSASLPRIIFVRR